MNYPLPQAPDYRNADAWAKLPDNPLRPLLPCDVFFAPGTLLKGQGPAYYDPADARHRALALRPLRSIASAFAGAGNIYQPHCRQISMEMNMLPRCELESLYQPGADDLQRAFVHYLETWNSGRPFFLVGHSQGTVLMLALLQRFFSDAQLAAQLAAAYLIGFTITPADLADLKVGGATGPDDTGVVISYNALTRDGNTALTLISPDALCINPLNWSSGPQLAPAKLHLGRVVFDEGGDIVDEIPHFSAAWVDPELGALKVAALCSADLPPDPHFPAGDLHRQNIALFYRNLEANACLRAARITSHASGPQ